MGRINRADKGIQISSRWANGTKAPTRTSPSPKTRTTKGPDGIGTEVGSQQA